MDYKKMWFKLKHELLSSSAQTSKQKMLNTMSRLEVDEVIRKPQVVRPVETKSTREFFERE